MATKSPSFTWVYNGVYRSDLRVDKEEAIESVGEGFAVGTVVASLYHFGKAALRRGGTLAGGLNAACAHGPRVGGRLALAYTTVDLARVGLYRYYRIEEDAASLTLVLGETTFVGAMGALMRAPCGFGPALRSALVWAFFPGVVLSTHYWMINTPELHYVPQRQGPYSYPHYRLQQQQEQEQDSTQLDDILIK